MRRVKVGLGTLVLLGFFLPRVVVAQVEVIDAANLSQNTVTAIQVYLAVLQRVTIIAQQLDQLKNMIQNTENFPTGAWDAEALPKLLELGNLIQQGNAVAYQMANLDAEFRRRWPGYVPPDDFNASYGQWTTTTLDTIRGVLRSNQVQADEFLTEETRLQALQTLSDTSVGRMQAIQAGNMIAGEEVEQLRKLRQLVMAQSNAQTVYMANQTNKEAQEVSSLRRWVMTGADGRVSNGLTGNGARAGAIPSLSD